MFCVKCGNKLSNNAKFCNKCGTAIPKEYIKKNKIDEAKNNEPKLHKFEKIDNTPVDGLNTNKKSNPTKNIVINGVTNKITSNNQPNSEQKQINTSENKILTKNNNTKDKVIKFPESPKTEVNNAYRQNSSNKVNTHKSKPNNAKSSKKNNSDEEEKFVYKYGAGKLSVSVLLTLFILVFSFNSLVIFSVRHGISKENFEDFFVDAKINGITIGTSNKNAVSLAQHIIDLMGASLIEKHDISESDMKKLLEEESVQKSFGDICYHNFRQFVDRDSAHIVTSEDFVNIFRNNENAVKNTLHTSFDESDYSSMETNFSRGFYKQLSTSYALFFNYPVKTYNVLLSEKMFWLNLTLIGICALTILLINKLEFYYMIKFATTGIDIAAAIILLIIIIAVIYLGTYIIPIVKWPFIIALVVGFGIESIESLFKKINNFLSDDVNINKDNQGEHK